MWNVETWYRSILIIIFLYIGVDSLIKGEITGVANKIPWLGKGVYNGGKPYFKIKGKAVYVIGVLFVLLALYLYLNR